MKSQIGPFKSNCKAKLQNKQKAETKFLRQNQIQEINHLLQSILKVMPRFHCETQNRGTRYLEAFPKADGDQGLVRVSKAATGNKDQTWYLDSLGDNKYHIRVETQNRGTRFLEAFPIADGEKGLIRPAKFSGNKDQQWFLDNLGGNKYHIRVETQNRGTRYLEAFPQADDDQGLARPAKFSGNKDQVWYLE